MIILFVSNNQYNTNIIIIGTNIQDINVNGYLTKINTLYIMIQYIYIIYINYSSH